MDKKKNSAEKAVPELIYYSVHHNFTISYFKVTCKYNYFIKSSKIYYDISNLVPTFVGEGPNFHPLVVPL